MIKKYIDILKRDGLKKFIVAIISTEWFLYLFIGFLTTVINIVTMILLNDYFIKNNFGKEFAWKSAEIVAFIIAVLFAFFANKLFVFKSKSFGLKTIKNEFLKFIFARIISELIVFIIMKIMIDYNQIDYRISKVLTSIIAIIFNYLASKFVIFKKNNI